MAENNNGSLWIIAAVAFLLAVGAFLMFAGASPATESEDTGAEVQIR